MTRFLKPALYILGGAALGCIASSIWFKRNTKKIGEKVAEDLYKEIIGREPPEPIKKKVRYANESIKKPDIRELMYEGISKEKEPEVTIWDETNTLEEPYLISESAIDYEGGNYDDEVAYTYYSDGILADENDEVIMDAYDILPSGWVDCFGYNCSSDDKFYAINPKLRLLMEVVRTDEPYLKE